MIGHFHVLVYKIKEFLSSNKEDYEKIEQKEKETVYKRASESEVFGQVFVDVANPPEKRRRDRRRRGSKQPKKTHAVLTQKRQQVRCDLDAFFRHRAMVKRQQRHVALNSVGSQTEEIVEIRPPTNIPSRSASQTTMILESNAKVSVGIQADSDAFEGAIDDVGCNEAAPSDTRQGEVGYGDIAAAAGEEIRTTVSATSVTLDLPEDSENVAAALDVYEGAGRACKSCSTVFNGEDVKTTVEGESTDVSKLSLDSGNFSLDMGNRSLDSINLDTSDTMLMTTDLGEQSVSKASFSLSTPQADEAATRNGVIPNLAFAAKDGALSTLSQGVNSSVYKGRYHGKAVAIKVSRIEDMTAMTEGQIHSTIIYHPSIIEILANYTVLNRYEGLVMERAIATVSDLVEQIKDNKSESGNALLPVVDHKYGVYFTSCIAKAISHLHDAGIVHLDINSNNVLLMSSGVPKLSNFSSSTFWNPENSVDLTAYPMGTAGYQAPEIIQETGYNASADWFSFGALLSYIGLGRLPWGNSQRAEMEMLWGQTMIDNGLNGDAFHQHNLALIITMIQMNPEDRVTYAARHLLQCFHDQEEAWDPLNPPQTPTLVFIQNHLSR